MATQPKKEISAKLYLIKIGSDVTKELTSLSYFTMEANSCLIRLFIMRRSSASQTPLLISLSSMVALTNASLVKKDSNLLRLLSMF